MWELSSFSNPDELARAAARQWLEEVAAAQRAGKTQCVAVSGGRIAHNFFSAVTDEALTRTVTLNNVHFFWADERCVPPDDSESNYRLARELLFDPMHVPANRIHRVHGEDPPEEAAKLAADEIKRVVQVNADGQPALDLVFLGLGEDGHVASLFPGEPESLVSDKAAYRPVFDSPKPPPERITLGYPAIAAARQVWMLSSGAGKEGAFRNSLSSSGRTPFARVLRLRANTKIFTDL